MAKKAVKMLGLFIAIGAVALQGQPQAPRLDSSLPVDISAGRCELLEQEDTVQCSGDVRITQGEALLTGNDMVVVGVSDERGFRRIEATGDVRYASGDDAISGRTAVYDADTATLVVSGDVIVLQGTQVMTGGELVYNTESGRILFTPPAGGRVRGLFNTAPAQN